MQSHSTQSKWFGSPLLVQAGKPVSIEQIHDVAVRGRPVALANETIGLLSKGRARLENRIDAGEIVYGINTGFGGNSHVRIPKDQLAEHQSNLLLFLSAGTGESLTLEQVRAAQLTTLLALAQGWSGVRPELVKLLAEHLNQGIVPLVPRHGSVGASGDLIPSSYIANALCGRGRVRFNGTEQDAKVALASAGLRPYQLQAKEGLALVNGTRVMTALASLATARFQRTFSVAVETVAMVVEAMGASHEHYDARIHACKHHRGQIAVAAALRGLLPERGGARLAEAHANSHGEPETGIQEVYSIRCAPQVLGVVPESLEHTRGVLEREAISANDNPLIDPALGDVLHGGNFMGQHVARAMDALKIDMAIVGNHMHALMALLMDTRFSRGLPNSLSPRLGVSQGFKGVQISQTALVVHLRHSSTPATVHTIPTEQFNQDVVSLGLHAALGASEMETKLCQVVAMTLLAACQAIDLRGCSKTLGADALAVYRKVREVSPMVDGDRPLDADLAKLAEVIARGDLCMPAVADRLTLQAAVTPSAKPTAHQSKAVESRTLAAT